MTGSKNNACSHTQSFHEARNSACVWFQQQLIYVMTSSQARTTQDQQSLHCECSICHLKCWCRRKTDHLTLVTGQLNKWCTGVSCTLGMRPMLWTSIDHTAAANGVRQDVWLAAAALAEDHCSLTRVPGVPGIAGTDVSLSDLSTPDTLASAWLAACTSNADRTGKGAEGSGSPCNCFETEIQQCPLMSMWLVLAETKKQVAPAAGLLPAAAAAAASWPSACSSWPSWQRLEQLPVPLQPSAADGCCQPVPHHLGSPAKHPNLWFSQRHLSATEPRPRHQGLLFASGVSCLYNAYVVKGKGTLTPLRLLTQWFCLQDRVEKKA